MLTTYGRASFQVQGKENRVQPQQLESEMWKSACIKMTI